MGINRTNLTANRARTGIDLPLDCDIIKAYGGEIKVQSKEGEGTEFIIQIPI